MRLAYLIHHDLRRSFGGSEVYARALAEAAADAGHEVLVICRGETGGPALAYADEPKFRLAVLNERTLPDPRARFRERRSTKSRSCRTMEHSPSPKFRSGSVSSAPA